MHIAQKIRRTSLYLLFIDLKTLLFLHNRGKYEKKKNGRKNILIKNMDKEMLIKFNSSEWVAEVGILINK